jgi:hypothetical protein
MRSHMRPAIMHFGSMPMTWSSRAKGKSCGRCSTALCAHLCNQRPARLGASPSRSASAGRGSHDCAGRGSRDCAGRGSHDCAGRGSHDHCGEHLQEVEITLENKGFLELRRL